MLIRNAINTDIPGILNLLLQVDMVILNHLRTTNNTGEMAEQEKKVQEFLIKR